MRGPTGHPRQAVTAPKAARGPVLGTVRMQSHGPTRWRIPAARHPVAQTAPTSTRSAPVPRVTRRPPLALRGASDAFRVTPCLARTGGQSGSAKRRTPSCDASLANPSTAVRCRSGPVSVSARALASCGPRGPTMRCASSVPARTCLRFAMPRAASARFGRSRGGDVRGERPPGAEQE